MRSLIAVLLTFTGVGLSAEFAAAQVFQPVGKQLGDVSGALQSIQAKSAVYEPADPDKEFKLFYIPFFALEESQPGSRRPKVVVQKSPTAGNGLVTLTLLLSPQNLVDGIASYVRSNAVLATRDGQTVPVGRYKNIQPFNLTGIPLKNLSIDEVGDSRYGFKQVIQPHFGAQGTLLLVAEMPMDRAEQVAAEIEGGKRCPQFDIKYDLASDQELSESQIRASTVYFYNTEAAKDLSSAKPSSEKFGIAGGPGGVQIGQPFVSKSERQLFEARIKTEVSQVLRLGDEKDIEFLRKTAEYFPKVFERTDLLKADGPISQQLANLSSYGLDPEELKADKLDGLMVDVKNFFSQEGWEKKTFKAGASASFLGIGGASGSVETSGESLHKQMSNAGWKFQTAPGSKITIPKAFEVHIVNRTALKAEGSASGAVIRAQRGFIGFNHRVSASNLYHPQLPADVLVAFEELRAEVRALDHKVQVNMPMTGVINIQFAGQVERDLLDPKVAKATIPYPDQFQFDEAPDVTLIIRGVGQQLPAGAGSFHMYAFAKNVTKTGFEVEIANLGTTKFTGLGLSWIAIPKRPK